jgi:serine protease Do
MMMKPTLNQLAAAVGFAALSPALPAAEEHRPPVREERREVRVIAGPGSERRPFGPEGERRGKLETEKVAFLGVEAAPVPPPLSAQLALPRGTGLVVGHVAPKSPAAGVLQEHDILLKLDDQILIEPRQLAVLIRNHQEGDEVVITYLRAGQKATAKVKLGVHEVPKLAGNETPGPAGLPGGARMEFLHGQPGAEPQRVEVDRLLSMLRRPANGEPVRIQIERHDGPGIRAMSINTGNSNIVFSDDSGALELTTQDGKKSLVAKDPKGAQIFSGPVTTPEERKALPPELRERLERLEGMREMSFKTGGDFQGAETRILRPPGRSISLETAREIPKARPDVL